jgi:hypothetical protein
LCYSLNGRVFWAKKKEEQKFLFFSINAAINA